METQTQTQITTSVIPIAETKYRDGRILLKVKLKSLAEEARIIRKETSKAKVRKDSNLANLLNDHRRGIVRAEARKANIVYAFLRGSPLTSVETVGVGNKYERQLALAGARELLKRFAAPWQLNSDLTAKQMASVRHRLDVEFGKWSDTFPKDCTCHLCQVVVIS